MIHRHVQITDAAKFPIAEQIATHYRTHCIAEVAIHKVDGQAIASLG
jgi:hypothetical protein